MPVKICIMLDYDIGNVWCVKWWCLSFSEPTSKKEYCSVELTDAKYKAFIYAIDNHYWYQMYIGKDLH